MNSPIDHGSPESSSSGSPPPEEASSPVISSGNYASNSASHNIPTIGNLSGPPSKRRLPQGSAFAAGSSSRDLKSRRRDREQRERDRGEPSRPGHPGWEKESGGVGGKKEPKDDLLDQGLVEHLRKGVFVFQKFKKKKDYFLPLACVFSIYIIMIIFFSRDWRSFR